MPNSLGTVTKSVFLIEIPSDEVFQEFTVAPSKTIYAGMPVELDADGKVQPATPSTTSTTYIGIALKNASAGELVTVGTIGLCVIHATAKATQDAGPVKWDSYDTVNGVNVYSASTVTVDNIGGWALDAAASAGDAIRVLIKE